MGPCTYKGLRASAHRQSRP